MWTLRTSRGRGRGNVNQGPGGAPLKGWEFIQEKTLSHDENMIADYADDIDTLLVFAGLFSAVLTAFLVVSLVLLQPDNSETTIQILSIIAIRLGAPADVQPFLNETAQSLPTSSAFKAPQNVATINTLWFTSLVLSLAAALFGILAKQWCREYLRWHSVIASARENMLIRQVRFEAWERWRVGAFIAFIPAFLEVALILFLIGLPIFTHTLSQVGLTTVVSLVVGLALVGVAVLTVLPVFSRLCPFQTPTGWAFVRLTGLMRLAHGKIGEWTAVRFDRSLDHGNVDIIRQERRWGRRPGWQCALWLRSMDRLSSMEKLTDWRAYGLYSVEDPKLCKRVPAALNIKEACEDIEAGFDDAAVDAVQTSTLFRALSWVRLGSSDGSVLAAIQESLPSIHNAKLFANIATKPHFLSAIHVMCPTNVTAVLRTVRTVFPGTSKGNLSFLAESQSSALSKIFGPFVVYALDGYQGIRKAWESNHVSFEISHALLRSDMLSLVDDWLSLLDSQTEQRQAVAERIALLLCMLRVLPSDNTLWTVREAGANLTLPWAETLEEVYRKLSSHNAAYACGLVSLCVEMCRLLGPLHFEYEQGRCCGVTIDKESLYDLTWWDWPQHRESNLVSTWTTLAVDVYRNTNHYDNRDSRHLFVILASRAFEAARLRIAYDWEIYVMSPIETIAQMEDLLSCMADALRWSLVHSQPNCGAYTPLPWIGDIAQCYQAAQDRTWSALYKQPLLMIPLTGIPTLQPIFFLILRLLKTLVDRDLVTYATVADCDESGTTSTDISNVPKPLATELDRLLELLEYPALPDLPADLTFEAIEAQRRMTKTSAQVVDSVGDTPDDKSPDFPGEASATRSLYSVHASNPSLASGVEHCISSRTGVMWDGASTSSGDLVQGDSIRRLGPSHEKTTAVSAAGPEGENPWSLPAESSSDDVNVRPGDLRLAGRPFLDPAQSSTHCEAPQLTFLPSALSRPATSQSATGHDSSESLASLAIGGSYGAVTPHLQQDIVCHTGDGLAAAQEVEGHRSTRGPPTASHGRTSNSNSAGQTNTDEPACVAPLDDLHNLRRD